MKTQRVIESESIAWVNMAKSFTRSENRFFEIASIFSGENKDITTGNMMSSPGIKYKDKVIAFYYNDEMVIRLGKSADHKSLGINNPKFLNPFKHKPPMTGWVCFSSNDIGRWEKLTHVALETMKNEID